MEAKQKGQNNGTKRLMAELKDLIKNPCPEFIAYPLDSDLFEWHFTVRLPESDKNGFAGGRYHGRIIFPLEYPFKPPNIMFLTTNGRFDVAKKICLSITGFHPESWRPAWGVRTALIAIISFFSTPGEGAVGALDWSKEAREQCAKESWKFVCSVCKSENATSLATEAEQPSSFLEPEPEMALKVKNMDASKGDLDADIEDHGDEIAVKGKQKESIPVVKGKEKESIPVAKGKGINEVKETVETKAVQSPETLSTMNTIWGIDLAIIILVVFVAVYLIKM